MVVVTRLHVTARFLAIFALTVGCTPSVRGIARSLNSVPKSLTGCFADSAVSDGGGILFAPPQITSHFETAGIQLSLNGAPQDAAVTIRYCQRGTTEARAGTDFFKIPGSELFAASLVSLSPNTEYDIEIVVSSESTGKQGSYRTSFRTPADAPPEPKGSAVYVSPAALDTNPGTEKAPFKTLSKALAVMKAPGSQVRTIFLFPRLYRGETVLDVPGDSGSYRALRAIGPGVIFDGADPLVQAGVTWVYDAANRVYSYGPLSSASSSVTHVFAERGGITQRLYPHESLNSLATAGSASAVIAGVQGGFFKTQRLAGS